MPPGRLAVGGSDGFLGAAPGLRPGGEVGFLPGGRVDLVALGPDAGLALGGRVGFLPGKETGLLPLGSWLLEFDGSAITRMQK